MAKKASLVWSCLSEASVLMSGVSVSLSSVGAVWSSGPSHGNAIGSLRSEFHDKEYRTVYANESLNAYIATQIKTLREQNEWTQARLAKEAGMAQPRIAVMEDIGYSSWSINTLRRLAEAFDLRLSVSFENFSSLIPEIEGMSRESLEREAFADDSWFHFGGRFCFSE